MKKPPPVPPMPVKDEPQIETSQIKQKKSTLSTVKKAGDLSFRVKLEPSLNIHEPEEMSKDCHLMLLGREENLYNKFEKFPNSPPYNAIKKKLKIILKTIEQDFYDKLKENFDTFFDVSEAPGNNKGLEDFDKEFFMEKIMEVLLAVARTTDIQPIAAYCYAILNAYKKLAAEISDNIKENVLQHLQVEENEKKQVFKSLFFDSYQKPKPTKSNPEAAISGAIEELEQLEQNYQDLFEKCNYAKQFIRLQQISLGIEQNKTPFLAFNGAVIFGLSDEQLKIVKQIDQLASKGQIANVDWTIHFGGGKSYLARVLSLVYIRDHHSNGADHVSANGDIVVDGHIIGFMIDKKPLFKQIINEKEIQERKNRPFSLLKITLDDVKITKNDISEFKNLIRQKRKAAGVLDDDLKQMKIILIDEFYNMPYHYQKALLEEFPNSKKYILSLISATPNIRTLKRKISPTDTTATDLSNQLKQYEKDFKKNISFQFISSDQDDMTLMNRLNHAYDENSNNKSTGSKFTRNNNLHVQLLMPDIPVAHITGDFLSKLYDSDVCCKDLALDQERAGIVFYDANGILRYYFDGQIKKITYQELDAIQKTQKIIMLYTNNNSIGGDFGNASRRVSQMIVYSRAPISFAELQQYIHRVRKTKREDEYYTYNYPVKIITSCKSEDHFYQETRALNTSKEIRTEMLMLKNDIMDELFGKIKYDLNKLEEYNYYIKQIALLESIESNLRTQEQEHKLSQFTQKKEQLSTQYNIEQLEALQLNFKACKKIIINHIRDNSTLNVEKIHEAVKCLNLTPAETASYAVTQEYIAIKFKELEKKNTVFNLNLIYKQSNSMRYEDSDFNRDGNKITKLEIEFSELKLDYDILDGILKDFYSGLLQDDQPQLRRDLNDHKLFNFQKLTKVVEKVKKLTKKDAEKQDLSLNNLISNLRTISELTSSLSALLDKTPEQFFAALSSESDIEKNKAEYYKHLDSLKQYYSDINSIIPQYLDKLIAEFSNNRDVLNGNYLGEHINNMIHLKKFFQSRNDTENFEKIQGFLDEYQDYILTAIEAAPGGMKRTVFKDEIASFINLTIQGDLKKPILYKEINDFAVEIKEENDLIDRMLKANDSFSMEGHEFKHIQQGQINAILRESLSKQNDRIKEYKENSDETINEYEKILQSYNLPELDAAQIELIQGFKENLKKIISEREKLSGILKELSHLLPNKELAEEDKHVSLDSVKKSNEFFAQANAVNKNIMDLKNLNDTLKNTIKVRLGNKLPFNEDILNAHKTKEEMKALRNATLATLRSKMEETKQKLDSCNNFIKSLKDISIGKQKIVEYLGDIINNGNNPQLAALATRILSSINNLLPERSLGISQGLDMFEQALEKLQAIQPDKANIQHFNEMISTADGLVDKGFDGVNQESKNFMQLMQQMHDISDAQNNLSETTTSKVQPDFQEVLRKLKGMEIHPLKSSMVKAITGEEAPAQEAGPEAAAAAEATARAAEEAERQEAERAAEEAERAAEEAERAAAEAAEAVRVEAERQEAERAAEAAARAAKALEQAIKDIKDIKDIKELPNSKFIPALEQMELLLSNGATQPEIKEIEEQLKEVVQEMKGDVEGVNEDLNTLNKDLDTLRTKAEELKQLLESVAPGQLEEAIQGIIKAQQEVEELESTNTQLSEKLAALKEAVKQFLQSTDLNKALTDLGIKEPLKELQKLDSSLKELQKKNNAAKEGLNDIQEKLNSAHQEAERAAEAARVEAERQAAEAAEAARVEAERQAAEAAEAAAKKALTQAIIQLPAGTNFPLPKKMQLFSNVTAKPTIKEIKEELDKFVQEMKDDVEMAVERINKDLNALKAKAKEELQQSLGGVASGQLEEAIQGIIKAQQGVEGLEGRSTRLSEELAELKKAIKPFLQGTDFNQALTALGIEEPLKTLSKLGSSLEDLQEKNDTAKEYLNEIQENLRILRQEAERAAAEEAERQEAARVEAERQEAARVEAARAAAEEAARAAAEEAARAAAEEEAARAAAEEAAKEAARAAAEEAERQKAARAAKEAAKRQRAARPAAERAATPKEIEPDLEDAIEVPLTGRTLSFTSPLTTSPLTTSAISGVVTHQNDKALSLSMAEEANHNFSAHTFPQVSTQIAGKPANSMVASVANSAPRITAGTASTSPRITRTDAIAAPKSVKTISESYNVKANALAAAAAPAPVATPYPDDGKTYENYFSIRAKKDPKDNKEDIFVRLKRSINNKPKRESIAKAIKERSLNSLDEKYQTLLMGTQAKKYEQFYEEKKDLWDDTVSQITDQGNKLLIINSAQSSQEQLSISRQNQDDTTLQISATPNITTNRFSRKMIAQIIDVAIRSNKKSITINNLMNKFPDHEDALGFLNDFKEILKKQPTSFIRLKIKLDKYAPDEGAVSLDDAIAQLKTRISKAL